MAPTVLAANAPTIIAGEFKRLPVAWSIEKCPGPAEPRQAAAIPRKARYSYNPVHQHSLTALTDVTRRCARKTCATPWT